MSEVLDPALVIAGQMIGELREQVRSCQAQVDALLNMVVTEDQVIRRFGLTRMLYKALLCMVAGAPEYVSRERMIAALYPGRLVTPDEIVPVMVSRLRKALAPYGVTIETKTGSGYRMPLESVERLRAAGWGKAT
jgi:DNA-binding winged helix-turn-helix (wHTH) protein